MNNPSEGSARTVVRDVLQAIKNKLKVDWTASHCDHVKAGVRSAVRRALRSLKVKPDDVDEFLTLIMAQAEASYAS